MEWFLTDWHWAIIIGLVILCTLLGVIVVVIDDDGDWFIF